MSKPVNVVEVGAADPELQNSPVIMETDDDFDTAGQGLAGIAACYFNGKAFDEGQYIRSGEEALRCHRGAWVPETSCLPTDPKR